MSKTDNVTSTAKVRTKLSKNDEKATETSLTIVWDIDEDKVRELAAKAVIIQQQAIYRASGKVPTTDTVNVSELLVKRPRGATNTPEAIAKKAAANPEFMAELKKQLGL